MACVDLVIYQLRKERPKMKDIGSTETDKDIISTVSPYYYRHGMKNLSEVYFEEHAIKNKGKIEVFSESLHAVHPLPVESFMIDLYTLLNDHELLYQMGSTFPSTLILRKDSIYISNFYIDFRYKEGKHYVYKINIVCQCILGGYPKELIERLKDRFNLIRQEEESSDRVPIEYAFNLGNGNRYRTHYLDPILFNTVKQNYSIEVTESVYKLFNILKESAHGLIILHGAVGTGKTYLVKSILSEIQTDRSSIVCVPPLPFLNNLHDLMDVCLKYDRSLIVMEDVGDIFTTEGKTTHIDASSNLFNITDGLLSLLGNIIILLTFNYNVGKIDPALLRPGRCLIKIETKRLLKEHAQKLVDVPLKHSDYSLAEVYSIKATGQDVLHDVKIGFRRKDDE